MAAGGASCFASRDPVVPRRPFLAPLFNEKEYFYRARVLRRAWKEAVSAGRPDRPAVQVSSQICLPVALTWSGARRQRISTLRTFMSASVSSRLRRGRFLRRQHHLRCSLWDQPSDPRRRRRRQRTQWRRRVSRLSYQLFVLRFEV